LSFTAKSPLVDMVISIPYVRDCCSCCSGNRCATGRRRNDIWSVWFHYKYDRLTR